MDGYYRRSRRVASRVVDGEVVLVKMPEGVLHVLNPSASRMWVRADGCREAAALAEGLDPKTARAFLRRMAELGFMDRAESPREEAEPFLQEVELPCSTDAPEISEPEPVEILASGSCLLVGGDPCAPSPSL